MFNYKRAITPGALLIAIYVLSSICGLLIGLDYEIRSFFGAFNVFFLLIILSFFILSWNQFKYKTEIIEPNLIKLRKLTIFLFVMNGLFFILFIITIYFAFTTVIDYTSFKNDGDNLELTAQLPINHTLYLFALYFFPTSYFLVPIHFYYLTKRKYFISIFALLLSLNIVLQSLTVFSRAGFIVYIFLYAMYLPFFYKKFELKTQKIFKSTILIIITLLVWVFYVITLNRFGEYLQYGDALYSKSFITNPELYSIFDYAGQWYRNSNIVMNKYSFETLNGQLSFPLIMEILKKLQLITYDNLMVEMTLYKAWGENFYKFNGITANLLLDFGYIGATLFSIIYAITLRSLRPIKGKLTFNKLLMLGGLFMLPSMGIFNSQMKTISYNALIVYSFFVYGYFVIKWKKN